MKERNGKANKDSNDGKLHILTTFIQLCQIQTLLHGILRPGSSRNSEAATITFTFVLIVVNSIVTLSFMESPFAEQFEGRSFHCAGLYQTENETLVKEKGQRRRISATKCDATFVCV